MKKLLAVAVLLSIVSCAHGGSAETVSSSPRSLTGSVPMHGAGTWHQIPTPSIQGREEVAAVWTGRSMIVWGGSAGDYSALNDGAAYDPATRTWSRLPRSPLPARFAPAAIWTGDRMIVWGGELDGRGGLRSDGATYRPSNEHWQAIPGAPIAGSSGIWTGREMFVWGVEPRPKTGFRSALYDPIENRWHLVAPAPISPADLPEAVWTGRSIIVVSRNAAAEYDPAVNSWSVLPAPTFNDARGLSVAVWTGTRLLAWSNPHQGIESMGAAYDPSRKSWTPTASPHRVIGVGDAVVWTGSEVLERGPADPNSNGSALAYDPQADRWRNLATPKKGAGLWLAGVWTGHSLITWGGLCVGGSDCPHAFTAGGEELSF